MREEGVVKDEELEGGGNPAFFILCGILSVNLLLFCNRGILYFLVYGNSDGSGRSGDEN